MWLLKTITAPVIVSPLDIIKKETDKHVDNISGRSSLHEIQKNCPLRNCLFHLETTINATEKYHLKEPVKEINT